jgi:hypothetical protein
MMNGHHSSFNDPNLISYIRREVKRGRALTHSRLGSFPRGPVLREQG